MTKPIHFEKIMAELEEIVLQLEKGELSLEASLKHFERGITLAHQCQAVLSQAEQKIEMLNSSSVKSSDNLDDE